jgi:putative oxidoreductase
MDQAAASLLAVGSATHSHDNKPRDLECWPGTKSKLAICGLGWVTLAQGTTVAFYRLEGTARRYRLSARDIAQYWPQMLSILRIMAALLFLEHGTAKLLGFPHGPGPMPAIGTLAWVQGVIELIGGALLALGLLTRPVAFILAGDMAVAYFMAHAPKNFLPLINGGDATILYCFIFLALFVAGPGSWSVDQTIGQDGR